MWWPLDKSLTHEDIRYSTLVCLLDAIRHGTTLLIDHHASPRVIDGSLDVIEEAVAESGVRAVLCYEVSDRDGPKAAQAGIRENVRFLKKTYQGGKHPTHIGASFGLHASLTLSDGTLDEAKSNNPQGGFHIHAAEGEEDQSDSLQKSGLRVVNRLEKHGILGPASILAHCVHVNEDEIRILAATQSWITHQPRSNLNNGVGVAPIQVMEKAGVRIGLGNDGFSNAMWEEWKMAYLVHKGWQRDPQQAQGSDIIRFGVQNNAEIAGIFFPGMQFGSLEPGTPADLVFVDYHPFTPLTGENLPWHIIFGFNEDLITTMMVGGNILMKDRELLTLDSDAICAHAGKLAKKVWQRYEENSK
jgi:putative selenium metabolism protein SsnA